MQFTHILSSCFLWDGGLACFPGDYTHTPLLPTLDVGYKVLHKQDMDRMMLDGLSI
jgi:hypothetical protein